MTNEESNRYHRHIILSEIGKEGQEKLKNASVLIIGAGGLGCPIIQYLAAAGVGHLGIIDDDVIEESNLQRQILFSSQDIGKYKAIQAKKRVNEMNPYISCDAYAERLTSDNALVLFSKYSIIVDGSDNFATRYLVNDACVLLNKPLVFGSIFKFEGQVSVFNFQEGPTYRCLYPEPPNEGEVPNCSEVGVLGVLPGLIGVLQANETLKLLLGIGEVLKGKLLMVDALTMNFQVVQFALDIKNKSITELIDYEVFCGTKRTNSNSVKLDELLMLLDSNSDVQLIDVREPHEFERKNIGGILIPLSELQERWVELDKNKMSIVICQSGVRSLKALEILEGKGFKQVLNLDGGLNKK